MANAYDTVWLYPVFTLKDTPDLHYFEWFNRDTFDDQLELRAYVMMVPDNGCHMVYVGSPEFDRPEQGIMAVASEKALLDTLWRNLAVFIHGRSLCGWRIIDHVWPKLINRSLAAGLSIPVWAKNDLTKKFNTINMLDISNIYRQGTYQGVRPLPALDRVVKMWTGRALPGEAEISMALHKGDWNFAWERACTYLSELHGVFQRYNGFVIKGGNDAETADNRPGLPQGVGQGHGGGPAGVEI